MTSDNSIDGLKMNKSVNSTLIKPKTIHEHISIIIFIIVIIMYVT